MSVVAGLAIADQILGFFGMSGPDVMTRILNRGGDKRRRLEQIEMLGTATAMHVANTLKALEGVDPQTSSAVKDGLLLTAMQTLAEVVRAADLDGSSAG